MDLFIPCFISVYVQAAMLDEMDEVFGVSALVEQEAHEERQRSYGYRELRGLRVAHDIDAVSKTLTFISKLYHCA